MMMKDKKFTAWSATYCMTYDNQAGINVGSCFFNCRAKESTWYFISVISPTSNESERFKWVDYICGERWNRDRRFCGKCQDDYYPLVYSYNMKYIECVNIKLNWLKYVIAAFLPLTFFFFLILGLWISVYSPQLDAFIIFSLSTSANIRIIIYIIQMSPFSLILWFI